MTKDKETEKKLTTTKATKPAKALTTEQRVERLERGFKFLSAKLRTHGIHLAPDAEPATDPQEEQAEE